MDTLPSSSQSRANPHPSNNVTSLARRCLLLCGGGTGGHVYPALAVASALRARLARQSEPSQPVAVADAVSPIESAPTASPEQAGRRRAGDEVQAALLYVGSPDGMERGLVQRESDLVFCPISSAAIRGRNPLLLLRNSLTLLRGVREARALIGQT